MTITTATQQQQQEQPPQDDNGEATPGDESEMSTVSGAPQQQQKEVGVRFPFPKAFYDPHTKRLMMDPVVGPDGNSYENNPETLEAGTEYYPNRALQAYIEEELDQFADAGSVRGTLLQWGKTMKSGWQQLLEKTALPAGEYRPLPDAFYCPISFDLIHQPVIDPDGHTYEKAAIQHWLINNTESPVTRNPLTSQQLRDNNALLQVLEFLTEEENEEVVHPSIRQWKQEHSTRLTTTPDIIPSPDLTSATTNTPAGALPTNQEELHQLQMRRRRQIKNIQTAWFLAFIVVMFVFPSYMFLFWMVSLVLILMALFCQAQANHQIRRAQIVQTARPDGADTVPVDVEAQQPNSTNNNNNNNSGG